MANPKLLEGNPDLMKRFMQASAEGWEWAAANPEEAADILVVGAETECGDTSLSPELCNKSMVKLAPTLLNDEGKWGKWSRSVGASTWTGCLRQT